MDNHDASPTVSTQLIYKSLGYAKHRCLVSLILAHKEAFEVLGTLRTETLSNGKGRPTQVYFLTLHHLTLLVGLARNTTGPLRAAMVQEVSAYQDSMDIQKVCDMIAGFDLEDIPSDRYVYVAKESESGRHKIGISKDPERRVKELNIGNPEQLKIVHTFLASGEGYSSEVEAHKLYQEHNLRSEWFGSELDLNRLPSFVASQS